MRDCWQLISDDGGTKRAATKELRTTEMPNTRDLGLDLGYRFESCLFTNGESRVLGRYQIRGDAHRGHHDHCRQHGLTRHAG